MRLFPDGGKLFEVISRYDDLLTMERRPDYEPGDTLALIAPFLVLHGISEVDIASLAVKATFTKGAPDLISRLQLGGWKVYCITTAYEQYALHLTHKLEIFSHNVACTAFPLDKLRQLLSKKEASLLQQAEADMLALYPPADDAEIKRRLDGFFREKLPGTEIGQAIAQVKPVGGQRKVAALNRFAEKQGQPLNRWVVVGDSITDARMLETVEKAGGLAIVFNGNEYCLPYATMGLTSTHVSDLLEVLQTWQRGGRKAVERLVKEKENAGGQGDRGHFHWLSGRMDTAQILELHKKARRLVRDEAGKLG
ncbi:MAG: hypothetical protein HYX84_06725 [Chloroflexi bacterium]|nr:hypothetical protein [Chloroflexota bacterium]